MALLTYLALGWSKGLVIRVMHLSSSSRLFWPIYLVVSGFPGQQGRASLNEQQLFKNFIFVTIPLAKASDTSPESVLKKTRQ